MPHYYFDLFDGKTVMRDEFGDSFSQPHDAADLASGLLVDIAREVICHQGGKDLGVVVRDESGHDVYWAALMFRDAHLDPQGPPCVRAVAPTLTIANPVDLIQQSREVRAASRDTWRQVQDTMADLSQTLREVMDTVRDGDALKFGGAALATKGPPIPG